MLRKIEPPNGKWAGNLGLFLKKLSCIGDVCASFSVSLDEAQASLKHSGGRLHRSDSFVVIKKEKKKEITPLCKWIDAKCFRNVQRENVGEI